MFANENKFYITESTYKSASTVYTNFIVTLQTRKLLGKVILFINVGKILN